ncbi:MAG: DHH family phosphoesterase [Clostridiales Family XIII bacterium]|jgi:c-di-AMP phosphodiesterase-like protein|nr:DHH family phosphoesterase [Clostridiales Family XIII bacterium]
MGDRLVKIITGTYIRVIIAVTLILAAALFCFDWRVGVSALVAGLLFVAFSVVVRIKLKAWTDKALEKAILNMDEAVALAMMKHPLPQCIVGGNDVIHTASAAFRALYPDMVGMKDSLEDLVGVKAEALLAGTEEKPILLQVGERVYQADAVAMRGASSAILVCLLDVTAHERLKQKYMDERKCFAHIQVDNYDALMASSPDSKKSLVAASIENTIRQWAAKMDASIVRYYTSKYFVLFDHKYYERLINTKFSILDEARGIETDADFPVSLSIGVGLGGLTPAVSDEYSTFALDLALGRGGDQAVVKRGSEVDYYGGTIQVVEMRNKGKSRIMAHALIQLVDQSSKVMVMGHKHPDIDAFASAIGIARIAINQGKEAHVVIGAINQSLTDFYQSAEAKGEYNFVRGDAAMELMDGNTLVVVVDTNRPQLAEAPKLVERAKKTVIFDHHRRTAEPLDATLMYLEPSASSTSELVTEVIQFISDKKSVTRFEAELLLGGIIVDTNSFSVKTGMRTFEAAAWLRGKGADTAAVRQYLQNDLEAYKRRAEIIARAEFLDDGIAVARNHGGKHDDVQLINAQAADDLLDIKGIKASFVIGESKSEVVISARSLGELNVQKIMERLGGGGHLTMAAAQLKGVSLEEGADKLKEAINETLR